ncbi:hypothetical protein CHGG_00202 [Chaetomium globosum CBS 148.51]|uniref:Uncharacterized protein n=1 Tax=Chaetomium globosum (strain ATCC 6205 / CBS 148.51 / DSM 1962 / NBRC 6347 / NRRL 1970) TaxID=306901 RepID=Q2HHV2_CHAGB|nr:uncharacterized protein CHGG_00202 [Chaetomium globosum CBS 148.51]EAQ91967.1 hypothetical protein CHGG_00202 [Chaetomium globosum CBS 148.51]
MASSEGVSLQGDLINAPSAALAASGLAQGLLRAVSADNVNPLAVTQVQAIGACFQSNGDWAARAPDLLTRTPSARLDRLSAWIGWSKGDVPSFMSQTAGGRTASLICLALGNLYTKERCGMILFDLSHDVLPSDMQNSGLTQLGDVCMCLQNKLACLGFGNHLAAQLTRLRECFFESGQQYPQDLADTPTEEVMHAFLVAVRDVLREENQTLYFSGSQCAGTLIALVLAMCPEDLRVEVNGEMIMRGRRDSIIFSVSNEPDTKSNFSVEQCLKAHTGDFSRDYIVEGRHDLNRQLSFSWGGFLSAQLDVAFAVHGVRPHDLLKSALATLVASAIKTFRGEDWLSDPAKQTYHVLSGIHESILNLVGVWNRGFFSDDEQPPRVCSSSSGSTIFAKTLEFPEIKNPWSIEYSLVDGRLQYGSDNFGFIICASVEKGSAKKLTRKKAPKTLLPKEHPISPSRIGEHSSFLMTLRPAFVEGQQALILRCIVTQSTSIVELNFQELHLGLMQLAPADSCEHNLASSLTLPADTLIKATSVIAPVASGKDAIGVTLTQRNGEAQFLCCISAVPQLYQGDCCISCAVTQAQEKGYSVVIGGSPSTYLVDLGTGESARHFALVHESFVSSVNCPSGYGWNRLLKG